MERDLQQGDAAAVAAHAVAAYLVGGFLIASVYAVGMLRGRRDRYHRLGFLIPFTVAAIATPVQMLVGDELARWVYNNEPIKFAAIELVPKTATDVPETLFGHLNAQRRGGRRDPDPGSRVDPVRSRRRHQHGDPGARQRSRKDATADQRRRSNVVHLAWDVMVGLGTLLFLLSLWFFASWVFKRRMPKTKLFLWIAAAVAACSRWSRSRRGGWSPRSVANPGSCATT